MSKKTLFGVIGFHGTGKSEMLCKLVHRLQKAGKTVAVVEQHPDLPEPEGRQGLTQLDSDLWVEPLADKACRWWMVRNGAITPDHLAEYIDEQVILLEGFKASEHPKILLVHHDCCEREANAQLLVTACPNVLAVVADPPLAVDLGVPCLSENDLDLVLELLEAAA